MGRRAQSEAKKKQKIRNMKDGWMAEAVDIFSVDGGPGGRSYRSVCAEVEEKCLAETGKVIHLNHGTLRNLVKGGKSLFEFNASKRWLTPEEDDVVIGFIIEAASRGFPLSHRRLAESVDKIIRARNGQAFPGVGLAWTFRFVSRNYDRLHMYTSTSLDSVRGRAVNPATNAKYFELLGSQIEKLGIEADCMWAADESGFQPNTGSKERVIGAVGKKTHTRKETVVGRTLLSW